MSRLDYALSLERARELLDSGRPAEALKLLRAPFPPALSLEKHFLCAEGLRAQGYFSRATPYYAWILRRPPGKDPSLWLESCLALAGIKRSLGDTAAARRLISQGLRLLRKADSQAREGFELESALIDRAQGLYRQSLARLRKFLVKFRLREDWAGAGFALWAMGGARRFSGDLKGSQRDFFSSLAAFRRAGDEAGTAYALFGLGGVTRIRGLLRQSQAYYARAGRLLNKSQDLFGQAYAHCGLANVLRQRGDLRRARRHYLRSHALYSRLGDRIDLAYVDWGLGKVALQLGELRNAKGLFQKALAAFSSGGEERGRVLAEISLAAVLHASGKTARAEALFEDAVQRARKAGLHAHLEVFT